MWSPLYRSEPHRPCLHKKRASYHEEQSKAKKHKVTQRALLEKVIKDVGPDAETADIEAVAKTLASMNLKKPGGGAKAGKRRNRSRRVRKSRHLRMKHSYKKRSGRKSRR